MGNGRGYTKQTERETRPGNGGSVCRRIQSAAGRYVTAWRLRKHRWPKGMRASRPHGVTKPQGRWMRPPGSASMPYQGYVTMTYNTGAVVKVPL